MSRTIYALADEHTQNGKENWVKIREEPDCGLRPLKQDSILVWAAQLGINYTIDRNKPLHPVIHLYVWKDKEITPANGKPATVAQHVQNLCDSCFFGSLYRIKLRQLANGGK